MRSWSFSSTQASLVPNGSSGVFVLLACAKSVCRIYVRISLPTVVQLTPRPRTAGFCCASSIGEELTDMARLAALKTFVQWENRMGVGHGSRTRGGTLLTNHGASAAATLAASAAAPPPRVPGGTAHSWGRSAPAHRWRTLPRHRKPLSCMRCRSHRRHWKPPPLRNRCWRGGGVGWPWWHSPDRIVAWGGNDPVGEFREPTLALHCLQLLELSVGRTDGSGLLRRCRLSQASCDEEGDEDRLLEF